MCEIRFSLSSKDGKLEQMVKKINAGARTEVVKEALRYYLSHVRDEKVESMYIDSVDLSEFKNNVKPNLFSMEDMIDMMQGRPVQAPMMMLPQQPISEYNQNTINNTNSDVVEVDENEEVEPNIVFDCDNTEVTVNEDMLDMNF
ncbi:MAG: hypothetical protein IJ086_03810 [Clostridium sp.]|nr:hypothetical protein [Clostridium sp.]